MTDKFFTTQTCDRCNQNLEGKCRKMSWFTEECLCNDCTSKENELKSKLSLEGTSVASLEGCGYLPTLSKG